DGRRFRRGDAFSVRYELEPLLRRHGEHHFADARLRRADGFFPRSHVPWYSSLRPQPCAALDALCGSVDGRHRYALFFILDSRDQQLDADAGGLQNRRWSLLPDGLDGDRFQSLLSLSPCTHCCRLLCDHGVRGDRGRILLSQTAQIRRRSASDVVDDPLVAHDLRTIANLPWRPAWSQHAALSAGEACGDRSTLDRGAARAAHTLCHSGPAIAGEPR